MRPVPEWILKRGLTVILAECDYCGEEFVGTRGNIIRGRSVCCSRVCENKFRAERSDYHWVNPMSTMEAREKNAEAQRKRYEEHGLHVNTVLACLRRAVGGAVTKFLRWKEVDHLSTPNGRLRGRVPQVRFCTDCGIRPAEKGRWRCEACHIELWNPANAPFCIEHGRSMKQTTTPSLNAGGPVWKCKPCDKAARRTRHYWVEDTSCAYCGVEVVPGVNTDVPNGRCVDHVVPISLGGPDEKWNTVIACHRCNAEKRLGGVEWVLEKISKLVAA